MRSEIVLTAQPRDSRGKNEARRLRAAGLAPAVVYGPGTDPVAVSVSPKDVLGILKGKAGHNTIFNLDVQGQVGLVMIIDWQLDPIKSRILHVDLKRIDPQKRLLVKVPVHTHGDPRGVKQQGGSYDVVTREVTIECLPDEVPAAFEMNVSEMTVGQSLRAGDLHLSGSMKLVSAPETVISHVIGKKGEAAEETAPVAAPAEPEVAKKGKKEEPAAGGAEKKKK
jgi:large subunit ribosomal protein L25